MISTQIPSVAHLSSSRRLSTGSSRTILRPRAKPPASRVSRAGKWRPTASNSHAARSRAIVWIKKRSCTGKASASRAAINGPVTRAKRRTPSSSALVAKSLSRSATSDGKAPWIVGSSWARISATAIPAIARAAKAGEPNSQTANGTATNAAPNRQ